MKPCCCIPSHNGVRETDLAAKLALDLVPDKFKILYTDLKAKISRFLQMKW